MLKIGKYIPASPLRDAVIERQWFRQGHIFKDEDAYRNHEDQVCYVPELTDATYTRKDILAIAYGNPVLADALFEELDWQHPESEAEMLEHDGEWVLCPHCRQHYGAWQDEGKCPACHNVAEAKN